MKTLNQFLYRESYEGEDILKKTFKSVGSGITGSPWRSTTNGIIKFNKLMASGDKTPTLLPIKDIHATQKELRGNYLDVQNHPHTESPQVVKFGGEHYVIDGHHRIAGYARNGQRNVMTDVWDMDK